MWIFLLAYFWATCKLFCLSVLTSLVFSDSTSFLARVPSPDPLKFLNEKKICFCTEKQRIDKKIKLTFWVYTVLATKLRSCFRDHGDLDLQGQIWKSPGIQIAHKNVKNDKFSTLQTFTKYWEMLIFVFGKITRNQMFETIRWLPVSSDLPKC